MYENMVSVPVCPKCGKFMVFTFAFRSKEYACLPCGTTEEFLCEKIMVSAEEHEKKRKLWEKDLQKLGLLRGGALCAKCQDERSCDDCKATLAHKYEYWKE